MRGLLGAVLAALTAHSATAATVVARDGRFEAEVSARQISRLSLAGERIASVRKLDEAGGPQMLLETDEKSGDVFIAFDGDVAGRTFTAFFTTESGRVVQAILRPAPGDGQTVIVKLDPATAPLATRPFSAAPAPYVESLLQFVRLMFNDQPTEAASRRVTAGPSVRAGPFSVRDVLTWDAPGVRGHVLYITNLGKTEEPVRLEAFLVARVYAAAASHERLRPGEQARIFVVEEPE